MYRADMEAFRSAPASRRRALACGGRRRPKHLIQNETGVSFGVSFFLQSTVLMSGNSGTDARFPSRVRQNVVVG